MAAALRRLLVLQMHAGHARALESLDRAHDLQDVAETGVGVADSRNVHGIGDVTRLPYDLLHAQQADVWVAGSAIAEAGARNVDRLETHRLDQHADGGIEGTRHDHRLLLQQTAEGGWLLKRGISLSRQQHCGVLVSRAAITALGFTWTQVAAETLISSRSLWCSRAPAPLRSEKSACGSDR